MDLGPVLHVWRQALTVDFLRYFLTAAPFYLVFWIWRPAWLRGRRIQASDPDRARVLSEFTYSLSTILIFAAIGTMLVFAERAGLTRIYLTLADHGRAYFWVSIAAAILVHDAYFYWTHRLLHWRPLFRLAHHVHHRSSSPTPWAAYAFHPLEALIQAGVYVVVVLTIPMHPAGLMLFLSYMIVRNVVGHLGFEVWPAGFARHPLTRWHLTATHHDLHHRFGNGNYGLYFSFWDDWVGTGRADYAETYEAVTAPRCALRRRAVVTAAGVLCVAALSTPPVTAQAAGVTPEGRWTTRDDHTGEVRSIVHIQIETDALRGRGREGPAAGRRRRRAGLRPLPGCATWPTRRRDGDPLRFSPGRESMDRRPRTRSRERAGVQERDLARRPRSAARPRILGTVLSNADLASLGRRGESENALLTIAACSHARPVRVTWPPYRPLRASCDGRV
jgi:Delta7-sterol 5-desaturase